ncbi:MAG: MaoC/PaaZ C-terminal domain-containing protein [Smithella sp.]|nr:MaoC/PaaZ C-terminal domain-containing protein [Smithella sp.]
MGNQWSLLREIKTTNGNNIEALADVSADSPWFSGHFPGEPILPGIALVYIVKQAIIEEALKKGTQLHLYSLRRIRFTQPVRPGDKLSISINSEDTGDDILFSFKVIREENVVSSGRIAAKKING